MNFYPRQFSVTHSRLCAICAGPFETNWVKQLVCGFRCQSEARRRYARARWQRKRKRQQEPLQVGRND